MASHTVDVQDNRDMRRVEARLEDGRVAAYAVYQIEVDGSFEFTHTEVAEGYDGRGIGSHLISGVMDFLRENDLRIVPQCTFIRDYMQEHPETHDLLADGASLQDEDEDEDEDEDGHEGAGDRESDGEGDEPRQDDEAQQRDDDQQADDDGQDSPEAAAEDPPRDEQER